MRNEKVDFDIYADKYDDVLSKELEFFGEENSYFAEYKIKIVKDSINYKPKSILEYGCGIGRNIKFLSEYFPEAKVTGCDISAKSIEIASEKNPGVNFFLINPENISSHQEKYDLIFISCVFHHIEPLYRNSSMKNVFNLLESAGHLFFFEHNPYNPLTLKIVRDCVWDKDAILLTPSESITLIKSTGLTVIQKQYSVFFPAFLKFLRPLEKFLSFIPIGGQYYLHAQK